MCNKTNEDCVISIILYTFNFITWHQLQQSPTLYHFLYYFKLLINCHVKLKSTTKDNNEKITCDNVYTVETVTVHTKLKPVTRKNCYVSTRKSKIPVKVLYSDHLDQGSCQLSPLLYFNLFGCNPDLNTDTLLSIKGFPEEHKYEWAEEIFISDINTPHSEKVTREQLDNHLKEYFQTSCCLTVNSVFIIDITKHFLHSTHPVKMYFKVNKIVHKTNNSTSSNSALVDTVHSKLYLEKSVNAFIPNISCTHIPPGLETYYQKLLNVSHPYMAQWKSCQKLLPILLIHGPRGIGKQLLVETLAQRIGVSLIEVDGISLVSDTAAATEAKIQNKLQECTSFIPGIIYFTNFHYAIRNKNNEIDHRICQSFRYVNHG